MGRSLNAGPLNETILRSYAPDLDAYREVPTDWLDELDDRTVHAGPPHQRMSTKAITEDEWFVVDHHYGTELALRAKLYEERPLDVFKCAAGATPACEEIRDLVDRWLSERGHRTTRASIHPLAGAGLAVQDDLCVMERSEDGWRLTAALLCFPTYWRLADKFGQVQEKVHGPVPHYAPDLATTVNRFFDRMTPDRIMSRRNWGFTSDPLLFLPDKSLLTQRPRTLDELWLRSERQTLRRMPKTGAIVFGIRVQLAPIDALLGRPKLTQRLATAMRAWTPELRASRGDRHGQTDELIAWLEARSMP